MDEGIGLKKQRVEGLGFRVRDLEVRVFLVYFGARVQGLGSTCRV